MKVLNLVILGLFTISIAAGCNQKSSKKGASSTDPTPTISSTPVVPIATDTNTSTTITGMTCTGSSGKSYVIDSSQTRMQVQSTGGNEDYTLTVTDKYKTLYPKWKRYSVQLTSNPNAGTGYIAIDPDTTTLTGKDRGFIKAAFLSIPSSLGGSTSTLWGSLTCN